MLRAFYIRWQRLQNAAIFVAGGLFFSAILAFAAANDSQTDVHWLIWGRRLPLWEVALFPLLAGLVLGYVYQLPARVHSVGEWFQHRQRVHELELELRELRSSLDHVLQMPETDRPAKLAKVDQKALPEVTESGAVDPFAEEKHEDKIAVAETKVVARTRKPSNGRRPVAKELPEEPPARARRQPRSRRNAAAVESS